MKIQRLNFFKKRESSFNVVDLGSSTVKVAVVREATELHEREVKGKATKLLPVGAMYAGQIVDLDKVINVVSQVLDEASMKAAATPHRTVLGLTGGVMIPRSFRVRIKRKDPDVKLDEDEFDLLAGQIEEKTVSKCIKELEEMYGGKYVRVETIFTAYFVDGAKVSSPLGLPGLELEITLLHYLVEDVRLRTINNLVDQLDLEVVSMVDTAVNVAVNWVDKFGDFVLVDIGGDVTQVVVVDKGRIAVSECLFIGGYDISCALQERLSIALDAAESIKVQYAHGGTPHEKLHEVRSVVSDVVDMIVDGVVTVLRESKVQMMPSTIVLTGESRHIPDFKTAFSAFPWTKEPKFSSFPKIEIAAGKDPNLEELIKVEL